MLCFYRKTTDKSINEMKKYLTLSRKHGKMSELIQTKSLTNRRTSCKNFLIIIVISLIVCAINFFYLVTRPRPPLFCYDIPYSSFKPISSHHLRDDELKIFFLETSCMGTLNSRQACSIESAARANREWNIIVLFTGPVTAKFERSRLYEILTSMKNVQFLRIHVAEFIKETPVESLFSRNLVKKSGFPPVHSSDILRLVVLSKYSGIYLDLDMIVVKSFDTLPKNFVVKEGLYSVTNCAMGFSINESGGFFLEIAIKNLAVSYNPLAFNDNGPGLFQRTLNEVCKTDAITSMSADTCQGIEVFEKEFFAPIYYFDWRQYFEDRQIDEYENAKTYAHHTWNTLSRGRKIPRESLFTRMAKKYCPTVYELYGDEFGN